MKLQPGHTVVHPHHGPATVVSTMTRTMRGEEIKYVNLELTDGKLQVSVPADSVEEIGIRELASDAELKALAEELAGPSGHQESQWSRRIKACKEEVASGDPMRLARVVRDLVRRSESNPLGTAEKDLLRQATAPLVAEIALSKGVSEERADEVIRTMVLEESTESLETVTEES